MQLLQVSGAVRPIYGSLGVKRLNNIPDAVKFVVGNIRVVPLTTNDFHEKPRSKPNTLPKQRK